MKFKLLHGSHQDLAGVDYSEGDIMESDVDLVKKSRGKWQLVDSSPSSAASNMATVITDAASARVALTEALAAVEVAKAALAKFAKDAEAAEAAEEAGKPTGEAAKVANANKVKAAQLKAAAEAKTVKPLGMKVTALFAEVVKGKPFNIHKNGALFDVVDKAGKVLTPDPLTKDLVVMFLKNNA